MDYVRKSLPERLSALLLLLSILAACGPAGSPERVTGSTALAPGDPEQVLRRKAALVRPSERQAAWQELEFQAFVHFGLDTFTDREWGTGTEDPALFAPSAFDADQWVKAFKAAGMKGVILTAKHHDGFCLWPSKYTAHSVAASKWEGGKGDVVREVAEACGRAGLKFGFYLSPWDRHEPSYGDSPRYNEHFKDQLRELLTGYGEISEVWFDGACGEGPNGRRQEYDWPGYWAVVRKYQPKAVISIIGPDARWVGNEAGKGRSSEWSVIPVTGKDDLPDPKRPGGMAGLDAEAEDLGSMKAIEAAAKAGGRLVWYPAQVDVSIRPGWFYHAGEDGKVRTVDELVDIYFASVGSNAQLLLNVPADRRGLIHENDVRRLAELGDALRRTFAVNLASDADISASSAAGPGSEAARAIDGDHGTYWMPGEENGQAVLELRFSGPRVFDTVMVRENIRLGQRIERFAVEVWSGIGAAEEPGGWVEVVSGTTVGYERLARFPVVETNRVRLRMISSRLQPAVSDFGLFLGRSGGGGSVFLRP